MPTRGQHLPPSCLPENHVSWCPRTLTIHSVSNFSNSSFQGSRPSLLIGLPENSPESLSQVPNISPPPPFLERQWGCRQMKWWSKEKQVKFLSAGRFLFWPWLKLRLKLCFTVSSCINDCFTLNRPHAEPLVMTDVQKSQLLHYPGDGRSSQCVADVGWLPHRIIVETFLKVVLLPINL